MEIVTKNENKNTVKNHRIKKGSKKNECITLCYRQSNENDVVEYQFGDGKPTNNANQNYKTSNKYKKPKNSTNLFPASQICQKICYHKVDKKGDPGLFGLGLGLEGYFKPIELKPLKNNHQQQNNQKFQSNNNRRPHNKNVLI